MSPGTGGRVLVVAFFPSTDSISAITALSSMVSLSPRLKMSKGAPSYRDRRHHALDDVIDICEISPRSPIAVDVDRFSVMNQISELVNCQIRSLARPVDGKKAQADRTDLIEVRIVRAQVLTG